MIPASIRILLVEDNPADARLVELGLVEADSGRFRVTRAERLSEALGLLRENSYDAVLLDLSLPDSHGLDTVSRVIEADPAVPIIVLSGLHDTELALQAVQSGAQDYLVKGESGGELISRSVRYAIQRKHAETELRRAHDELERRVAERTADLLETNVRLQREIESRHRAEDVLREEHGFISAVLDTLDALVVVLDRGGRVVSFNRAFAETTGYTLAEAHGEDFWSLFLVPEEAKPVLAVFDALTTSGRPSRNENRLRARDGATRLIAWSNTVLRGERGEVAYAIGTGIDITERRQAEDRERQRLLEIAHVARLSTMGEMATELAHEINQPLTAIAAYSDACVRQLRSGSSRQEELIETLERIGTQARRAGEIVRRVRSYVRKEESPRTRMDLNELVREVVHLAEAEARWRGVGIELDLAGTLPPLTADRILIEQVLLNLVRNAIEAMDDVAPDERRVLIRTSAGGDAAIEVAVRDSGPGLAPELVAQVFAPFFTTKPSGMGLGLSISQSIVEAHGGRLWAAANEPRGAVFQFSLPADNAGAQRDAS